jgi:CDP-glucose 4,6-dehydratase
MGMNLDFWKDKKILLTGHTGFKGSWLSLWLQKLGADLVGYSKSIPTKPSLYELSHVENKMISVMGDVCDLDKLKDVIREHKPEIVIHMAAQSLVQESYKNPIETYTTNVLGTVNVMQSIRDVNCVRVLINVTSDKCYENNDLERGYNENDPMGGFDPYSSSKGCAELVTASFRNSFFNPTEYKKHRTAIATARAGNVIGGGDWAQNRIIPDVMKGILEKSTVKIRNPNAVRPWQFVLEPLHGYMLLAEKLWYEGPKFSEGWNFGPDYNDIRSVSWLVERLSQLWNTQINLEYNKECFHHEANTLKLDCTKAKQKLGWQPKTNLELGLKFVVEWYKHYELGNDIREITEQQIKEFSKL